MTCYKPMDAYRDGSVNPETGKGIIKIGKGPPGTLPLLLPCGRCTGCRLEQIRQWAVRLMHEASLHENNTYVTLTYDDKHCPRDYSIHKPDFQKFIKRLRKSIEPKRIKYFHSGEYGDDFARPHFHAILFGHSFQDQKYWKTIKKNPLYTSEELTARWGLGFCSLGAVTFQSAAYVAKYCIKRRNGEQAKTHYLLDIVDPETGEIERVNRLPEYSTGSNGLGKGWFEKFHNDVYPDGFVIVNGVQARPPRYYDKQMEKLDKDIVDVLRKARRDYSRDHAEDSTPERLEVREAVQKARLDLYPRTLK